jgi:hypothetical protein
MDSIVINQNGLEYNSTYICLYNTFLETERVYYFYMYPAFI